MPKPSKGERHLITLRVAPYLSEKLDQWHELGYSSRSDYGNVLLAEALQLPVPGFVVPPHQRPDARRAQAPLNFEKAS